MSTPTSSDVDRLFQLALNLDVDPALARSAAYAKLLVEHTGADPGRLAAVASAAQQALDQLSTGETEDRAIWNRGVELAAAARRLVGQAGDDPEQRAALLAALSAEWFPDRTPYRQRLWHRHRWPRRVLRRFSPRWWARRMAARRAVLVYTPADVPAGVEKVSINLGGREVGRLLYQVCHRCRWALIGKASVNPDHQGRGLGTRAVRFARSQAPEYRRPRPKGRLRPRRRPDRPGRLQRPQLRPAPPLRGGDPQHGRYAGADRPGGVHGSPRGAVRVRRLTRGVRSRVR